MSLVSGNVLVPAWIGLGFFVCSLALAVVLDMVHNFILYYQIAQGVRNKAVHLLQQHALNGLVLMQGAMAFLFVALVLNVGQTTRASDSVISPWIIFVAITIAGFMLARLLAHFFAVQDSAVRANIELMAALSLACLVFSSLSTSSGGRWFLWAVAVAVGSYTAYLFHCYAQNRSGHAIAIYIVVAACFAAYVTVFVLGYTQTQQILFINELWSYWALAVVAFIIVPAWAMIAWYQVPYDPSLQLWNQFLWWLKNQSSVNSDGTPVKSSISWEGERTIDASAAAATGARDTLLEFHGDPVVVHIGKNVNGGSRRTGSPPLAAAGGYAPVAAPQRRQTFLPNL